MALAVGELQAFYVSLSLVTAIAVLFDFRIGASCWCWWRSTPRSSSRTTCRRHRPQPLNMLLIATIASYVLRHSITAPAPTRWCGSTWCRSSPPGARHAPRR
jgi:hypothetical protein